MSTRHKKENGPLSQNRYMSSVEFSELRGINGIAVSTRAAILYHHKKRELLWFLQALSLKEGGLRRLAKDLIETFPDRVGTPTMHKAGVKPGKKCAAELTHSVRVELLMRDVGFNDQETEPERGEMFLEWCKQAALRKHYEIGPYDHRPLSIEEFIIDLCINPRIAFSLPGEVIDSSDLDSELALEKNPELEKADLKTAKLVYFHDILGVLLQYKSKYETNVREGFQLTAIGQKVWEALDYAVASRGMVVLDGLEGRGKTEAAKAWCESHLGVARFVSLKGISNKTTAFREIAKALGIASSYTRTATDMQARIEDVLKRSKLLLVIDEAHFLFNQARRMYGRPELIDWIDTAICNQGIGCALVTTPQFLICMTRAVDQVEWNFKQFRRRVKRWVKLPTANTEEDIRAVARSVFKKAPEAAINKIVGYALLSKRDVSAVGDVAAELRVMSKSDALTGVSTAQVHQAIYDFLLPSDRAFMDGMEASRSRNKKAPKLVAPMPEISVEETGDEPPGANSSRTRRIEDFHAPVRFNEPVLTGH